MLLCVMNKIISFHILIKFAFFFFFFFFYLFRDLSHNRLVFLNNDFFKGLSSLQYLLVPLILGYFMIHNLISYIDRLTITGLK
jgi:hypothetical protein